ncbi:MAG: histidine phosphatase family protein [Gammaproteobacteria bacterium]|nr:histidine phosphatase family protein [Gammaproteobacteria bacterium]
MTTTRLDYLRHGQPIGGTRFRGNGVDDPLSELGWQQMRDTVAALAGWQRIVSSPMQRCRPFAEWLAEQRGLPVTIIDDLREVGFGDWEGVARDALKRERRAEYDAFYADPVSCRPGGAEPLERFGARVAAVFDRLVAEHAGEHLLVVCHAGVIRATLGHVTRAPAVNWYRSAVDNAALSRFERDHNGDHLLVHNWRPRL